MCLWMYTMCVQNPWKPEEGFRSPGTEVVDRWMVMIC